MLDVECWTLDVLTSEIPKAEHPTFNVQHPTSKSDQAAGRRSPSSLRAFVGPSLPPRDPSITRSLRLRRPARAARVDDPVAPQFRLARLRRHRPRRVLVPPRV